MTDTRVGGSIVSKRNKIFLGWRTAGNYEVAKEKYRAAIIGGAGRAARTSGRRKKKRREEKGKGGWAKEGENRLEEELPEITENVERMKGGGRGKPVFEARVEKGRELACPGASSF